MTLFSVLMRDMACHMDKSVALNLLNNAMENWCCGVRERQTPVNSVLHNPPYIFLHFISLTTMKS